MAKTRLLFPVRMLVLLALVLGSSLACSIADAATFRVVHAFGRGTDGQMPSGALLLGKHGMLIGTTPYGGLYGAGTVFEIAKEDGTEIIPYSFQGGSDGEQPYANVIMDKAGNIYGTMESGGISSPHCGEGISYPCGVVFKLARDGTETVLHFFTGYPDGNNPYWGLIADKAGNIFGSTGWGGKNIGNTGGTIFEMTPDGTEKILYRFSGTDGFQPISDALVRDRQGNLYGTTGNGGIYQHGVFFKLAPDGTETVLHAFGNGQDGSQPTGGMVVDPIGNMYGTTIGGGTSGDGTIYKMSPDGRETILYSFSGSDGKAPTGGIAMDQTGNLFGATAYGGTDNLGTLFELGLNGSFTTLYTFLDDQNGCNPMGGILLDPTGNLDGTASGCGKYLAGTLFTVNPN